MASKRKADASLTQVRALFARAVNLSGEKAADAFTEGLALARTFYPTDADALSDGLDLTEQRINLAITLQQLRRWEAMRDVTQDLLAQYPDARNAQLDEDDTTTDGDALCLYAIALQHCGDLPGALQAIDLALERRPEQPDSHHERACILHLSGNTPAALASMKRAIELDDDDRRTSLREDEDFASLHGHPDFEALTQPPRKSRKKKRTAT